MPGITCECCGFTGSDWTGYYCADTPILKPVASPAQIEAHNGTRLWLCTPCHRNLLRTILRTRSRADWQPILDAAKRDLRPGEGMMDEDCDTRECLKERDEARRERDQLGAALKEARGVAKTHFLTAKKWHARTYGDEQAEDAYRETEILFPWLNL